MWNKHYVVHRTQWEIMDSAPPVKDLRHITTSVHCYSTPVKLLPSSDASQDCCSRCCSCLAPRPPGLEIVSVGCFRRTWASRLYLSAALYGQWGHWKGRAAVWDSMWRWRSYVRRKPILPQTKHTRTATATDTAPPPYKRNGSISVHSLVLHNLSEAVAASS